MKNIFSARFLNALALPLILAGALVLRLILAPQPGLDFDVGTNQGWARSAVELGLARSYREQVGGTMLPNYPPFSLMIFGAVGHAYKTLISPNYDTTLPAYRVFIKLPGIIADLLIAIIITAVIGHWRGRAFGLLAAGVIAIHPAIFYESAFWGQTDSIFTLFLLGAFLSIASDRPLLGGALSTLAFLTKAQTVAFAPLLLALYLLRPRTILPGFIGSLIVAFFVLLPFSLGGALVDVWNVYVGSVGYNAILSSSAYNLWWGLFADAAWGKSDADLLFGLVTYRTAGFAIFGGIIATMIWSLRHRLMMRESFHKRLAILSLAAGLSSAAFFLFMTEMHERYMFPFVILALPAAFLSARAAKLYALASFLFFLNLLGFLPWTPVERALHNEFPSLDVMFASMQICIFVLWMNMTLSYRRDAVLATVPPQTIATGKQPKRGGWFAEWFPWNIRPSAKA